MPFQINLPLLIAVFIFMNLLYIVAAGSFQRSIKKTIDREEIAEYIG